MLTSWWSGWTAYEKAEVIIKARAKAKRKIAELEQTPLSADERAALRKIAHAATPGRWAWRGNTATHWIELRALIGGLPAVMRFTRWGMQRAAPAFAETDDLHDGWHGYMERATKWFRPTAPHNEWDICGIDHPNAEHIAAADPTTVLRLLNTVERQDALLAELREIAEDARLDGLDRSSSTDLWHAGLSIIRDRCDRALGRPTLDETPVLERVRQIVAARTARDQRHSDAAIGYVPDHLKEAVHAD